MAKRRFQDPELEIVGKWWQIRIYEDEYVNGRRIRKRVRLAPATTPVREVQKIKAEFLRPMNQGLISARGATSFEDYVRSVYITTEMPLMASSTQSRYRGIVNQYLIPSFGGTCLRELTPLVLQKYISGFRVRVGEKHENGEKSSLKQQLSHESIDKIRECAIERTGLCGEVRIHRQQSSREPAVASRKTRQA